MSEVNALKTLRETTLAHLAQSDYEKILKAVEVGGIDSLTGTAAMVVKSAVLKHGSHDQSSHNPKKGGGGAGGGGSTQSSGDPVAVAEAKADIQNRIAGADGMRGRSNIAGNPDVYEAHIDGVIGGFQASAKAVGKKGALAKLKADAAAKIPPVPDSSAPDSAFTQRAEAIGFSSAVSSIAQMYGNLDEGNSNRSGGASIIDLTFPGGTFGD
jgi:hypothetical protein